MLGFNPTVAPYDGYVHYVAAAAIAVIGALNCLGVRWGSLLQNVTTVAKYFGLLFIILVALAIGLPKSGGHFTPAAPAGSFSIAPFGLALVSVLWAYDGWADLAFISGEVKDPARNLPRALIYGTIAVVVIYILANIAYLGVMTVGEMSQSKLVAADVALRLIGQPGVVLVSLTVMLSTLGTLNGSILTNPRVFFAMAADGMLFRKVAAVHPKYQTPYVAIILGVSARHRLRVAANVRAARGHIRHGDSSVLRTGRGVDLRVPAARLQPALPRAAVSVRADRVRHRRGVPPGQRTDR